MRLLAGLASSLFVTSLAAGLVASACGGSKATSASANPSAAPGADAATSASANAAAASTGPADSGASTSRTAGSTSSTAKGKLGVWLASRLPPGGRVVESPDGTSTKVLHTVSANDTHASIATAYLDLTSVYLAADLAKEIHDRTPDLVPGREIEIPSLLAEPYPSPADGRLGWPKDHALRGIFLTGPAAQKDWVPTLDRLAARGMNAVVLDSKDYTGPVNYASKAKVAVEVGATANYVIPDLARMLRFAHARGVRVIMRISCFHDPLAAKKAGRLSIQGNWGKPFPLGWLDPVNVEAQDYIIELVKESIEAGADEIQLDYVRFPVFGGLKSAIMPPGHGHHRIDAIRDFVRRVHAITKPASVPLSLDIFGVTATGDVGDMEMLGQDIGVLGKECEALSPMVYPSHYDEGYRGFAVPGDHPEIVGIGTKAAVDKLKAARDEGTVVRSWLQAFKWKSPGYSPAYLVAEAKSAESNGGHGWLMWNPGCQYGEAWRGFPKTTP